MADFLEDAIVEAGWLDGEGEATKADVIERATRLVHALIEAGAPTPRVYPTPEGGLQADWTFADREVSANVEPSGSLYVISVDVHSGEATDETIEGDEPGPVLRLVLPHAS